MAKPATRKVLQVSPQVDELFRATESFIHGTARSAVMQLKIQVEMDFRGKPALVLRVRDQDVDELEIMPTLRYPQ